MKKSREKRFSAFFYAFQHNLFLLSEDFAAGGGEMKRNAMMFVEESRGRM
jgi:hypothetical protein